MKCNEIKPYLAGYLDDELNSELRKIVEEHLQTCTECASELEEMKKIREMLHKMSTPKMPDAFWQTYWQRIYNKIERGIGWIIFSIGAIILLAFGAYHLIADFFIDPSISILVRIAVGAIIIGLIILIVSIVRERFFALRHERYKEVER